MSAALVYPGSLLEVRTISVHHVAAGETRVVNLEVLATSACPECRVGRRDSSLGALGTLEISTDGGVTYSAVPDAGAAAMTGPNIGPLAGGARVPVSLRYTLPAAPPGAPLARSRSVELVLGFGT